MFIYQLDGSMQERRNSIAKALELRFSCINPSPLLTRLGYVFIALTHRYGDLIHQCLFQEIQVRQQKLENTNCSKTKTFDLAFVRIASNMSNVNTIIVHLLVKFNPISYVRVKLLKGMQRHNRNANGTLVPFPWTHLTVSLNPLN